MDQRQSTNRDGEKALAGAINELALQNVLRKRHCKDWPNVILQLTKRVQVVNQTWAQIVSDLMQIEGLRVSWYRQDRLFIVEIRFGDEVECHEIKPSELLEARQYIEVLLMDKLDHSELIAKVIADQDKKPELPG